MTSNEVSPYIRLALDLLRRPDAAAERRLLDRLRELIRQKCSFLGLHPIGDGDDRPLGVRVILSPYYLDGQSKPDPECYGPYRIDGPSKPGPGHYATGNDSSEIRGQNHDLEYIYDQLRLWQSDAAGLVDRSLCDEVDELAGYLQQFIEPEHSDGYLQARKLALVAEGNFSGSDMDIVKAFIRSFRREFRERRSNLVEALEAVLSPGSSWGAGSTASLIGVLWVIVCHVVARGASAQRLFAVRPSAMETLVLLAIGLVITVGWYYVAAISRPFRAVRPVLTLATLIWGTFIVVLWEVSLLTRNAS